MRCPQRQDARKRTRDNGLNTGPGLRRNDYRLCVWLRLAFWGTDYPLGLKAVGFTGGRQQNEDRFWSVEGNVFQWIAKSSKTYSSPTPLPAGLVQMPVQLLWSWAEDLRLAKNNHSFICWVIMNPARFPGLLHHLPIEKEQWHNQRSSYKSGGRSRFRQHGSWNNIFGNK